ncbi:MAG: glycosyltransferase [Chitinophagales bacterium]
MNLGGPTYIPAILSKYLQPEFETLLISGMKDDSEASSDFILKELGIEATYIDTMYRSIRPNKDLAAYRQIKAIIQSFKPDIVHTHAAKAGAIGRLAAKHCGVPVVLHTFHGHVFHSYFNALKTQVFINLERYFARISSRIIAISPKQKIELGEEFKICANKKIEVIPLGFDLSRFYTDQAKKRIGFRQKYQIAEDEIAIGIIGRLVPIKNHKLFLDALSLLQKKVQNTPYANKVRAFVIGDGEERDNILQYAENIGLDYATAKQATQKKATLTFTSWITTIDQAYAGLDIVALTSLNEGTPVALIEAQAAQKAIVSTDVGGVTDIVQANKTALIADSGDAVQISKHLYTLVSNENLRLKMGQTGRPFAEKKFGYATMVANTSKLYTQLLCEADVKYRKRDKKEE